jgi:diguanylate cyclase (GGDEF)-like protein
MDTSGSRDSTVDGGIPGFHEHELEQQLEAQQRQIEKLKTLIDVSSIISSSLDKTLVLKSILNQTKLLMECSKCSILLVDPEINELRFEIVAQEDEEEELKNIHLKMGEGIAGYVWERGKPILIEDARSNIRFSSKADNITDSVTTSIVAVPLVVEGKIIGVMEAINKLDNTAFTEFDKEILDTLSTQAAVAIQNAELYKMAVSDGMTRLFIHRYFQERMAEEYSRAERYNSDVALIMFDLDHFKNLNDTYGHQAGDEVLKKAAQLIKTNCRTVDIPCRYGGEEFCVILPHTGAEEALVLGERIRANIEEQEILFQGTSIKVTVSGGIASFKAHNPGSKEELIQMADHAMYISKETSRNLISIYTADDAAL